MPVFPNWLDDRKVIARIIATILVIITFALVLLMCKLDGTFSHPKAGEVYYYLYDGNPFTKPLTQQVICYSNHWVLYSNYLGYVDSEKESVFLMWNKPVK